MATTLELLLEAEKRGMLDQVPQDKVDLLSEARKRGLIDPVQTIEAEPVPEEKGMIQRGIEGIPQSPFLPVQHAVKAKEMIDEGKFRDFPIGATVGGTAGAMVGATAGGPVGATIGASLGAGFGESMEQIARRIIGLDAPETPGEAAIDIGKEMAIGGFSELGGQFAVRVAGKALAPFKGTVSTEAEKVMKFFKNKTRKGIFGKRLFPLAPAQATDVTERTGAAGLLDFMHNIADNSIIGSSAMRRFNKQNIDVIGEVIDDLLNSMSKQHITANQLGVTLNAVLKGNLKIERAASDVLYNTIDDMLKNKFVLKRAFKTIKVSPSGSAIEGEIIGPGLIAKKGKVTRYDPFTGEILEREIPLSKIKNIGKSFTTQQEVVGPGLVQGKVKVGIVDIGEIKGFAKNIQKLASELKGFGAEEQGFNTVAKVLQFNDNLSFNAAKNARTSLLNMARNMKLEGKTDPAIGLAKSLASQLDTAIEKALKKHSPKALKLWRKANRAYIATNEQYDNRLIREIFDLAKRTKSGNPEDIVKAIFKPGEITNVKRIKRAVDARTWGEIKRFHTSNLLLDSTSTAQELASEAIPALDIGRGGVILQGAKLKRNLLDLGNEILNTIYTPKELVTLKAVASAMDLSQKTVGKGLGRMFIQLSQAGAIIGVLSGRAAGLGLPLIVGPGLLSRVFTNPVTAKWLIQGYRLPIGTPQFARVMARLAASIAEMEAQELGRKAKSAIGISPPQI